MPIHAAPAGGNSSPFTTNTDFLAHTSDTTGVHGITDTSALATTAAVAATYAPLTGAFNPGLADSMPALTYFAHRGGSFRYPSHSMEGYRAAAASGFAIECDIRALADGTLVVQHDATLDGATDGTGNVIDATLATYLAARTDPPVGVMGVSLSETKAIPVLWDQVLSEFGGRALICVEAKTSAVVTALLATITDRGLHRSVIFTSTVYADCVTAAAAGVCTMYLADSGTWATVAAAGIEHVGMSKAVAAETVAAAQAEDLAVHIYTVYTLAEQTTQLAKSPDGLFVPDPWWLSGRYVTSNYADWSGDVPWPGMRDADISMLLRGGKLTSLLSAAGNGYMDCRGLFGTRDASSGVVKARVRVRFRSYAENQTRWIGLFMGVSPSEICYDDSASTAGQAGYTALVKRDGTLQLYYHADSSAASSLGTTAGTVIAAAGEEGEALIEMEINETSVVLRNLTTGDEYSNAHTTHRSAVTQLALGYNGTNVELSEASFLKES